MPPAWHRRGDGDIVILAQGDRRVFWGPGLVIRTRRGEGAFFPIISTLYKAKKGSIVPYPPKGPYELGLCEVSVEGLTVSGGCTATPLPRPGVGFRASTFQGYGFRVTRKPDP